MEQIRITTEICIPNARRYVPLEQLAEYPFVKKPEEYIDGIITGCILATGRILGESAALLFTAGFAHTVNGVVKGLQSAGATLTVALYVYAKEQGEFEVAFGIAAILVALTLILNVAARLVGAYFKKKRA